MKKLKVAFLGAGSMGSALIRGALKSGVVAPKSVSAFDVDRKRVLRLSRSAGIRASASNRDAMRSADYVFLYFLLARFGSYSLLIQGTILIIIILISPQGLLGIFNRFSFYRSFTEFLKKPVLR